jgi:hypothetical protein
LGKRKQNKTSNDIKKHLCFFLIFYWASVETNVAIKQYQWCNDKFNLEQRWRKQTKTHKLWWLKSHADQFAYHEMQTSEGIYTHKNDTLHVNKLSPANEHFLTYMCSVLFLQTSHLRICDLAVNFRLKLSSYNSVMQLLIQNKHYTQQLYKTNVWLSQANK